MFVRGQYHDSPRAALAYRSPYGEVSSTDVQGRGTARSDRLEVPATVGVTHVPRRRDGDRVDGEGGAPARRGERFDPARAVEVLADGGLGMSRIHRNRVIREVFRHCGAVPLVGGPRPRVRRASKLVAGPRPRVGG